MNRGVLVLGAILAVTAAQSSPRIVGGSETSPGAYPYVVAIYYSGRFLCGGTIINRQSVLSAAHCFANPATPQLFEIRAGSPDMSSRGQLVKVSRIVIHPDYNRFTKDFDVAVVKVTQLIQFNSMAMPIRLADASSALYPMGTIAAIAGWGLTSSGGLVPSRYLRAANVSVCGCGSYVAAGYAFSQRMFCAAAPGRDACDGDSGGPLVTSFNSQPVQMGITSWGESCASSVYPGVYTAVAQVRTFIDLNSA